MVAVFSNGGHQYRVSSGDTVVVDRMQADIGSTVELSEVLLITSDDDTQVGTPTVEGAKVVATVVSHDLGKKRDIYKYRRARRHRHQRGFRPQLTTLKIESISA